MRYLVLTWDDCDPEHFQAQNAEVRNGETYFTTHIKVPTWLFEDQFNPGYPAEVRRMNEHMEFPNLAEAVAELKKHELGQVWQKL